MFCSGIGTLSEEYAEDSCGAFCPVPAYVGERSGSRGRRQAQETPGGSGRRELAGVHDSFRRSAARGHVTSPQTANKRNHHQQKLTQVPPPSSPIPLVRSPIFRLSGRFCFQLCFRPPGTRGSDRKRRPLASKIAFAMAGARPIIGHSPAPTEGKSVRSSRTVSRTGMSLKRGTR